MLTAFSKSYFYYTIKMIFRWLKINTLFHIKHKQSILYVCALSLLVKNMVKWNWFNFSYFFNVSVALTERAKCHIKNVLCCLWNGKQIKRAIIFMDNTQKCIFSVRFILHTHIIIIQHSRTYTWKIRGTIFMRNHKLLNCNIFYELRTLMMIYVSVHFVILHGNGIDIKFIHVFFPQFALYFNLFQHCLHVYEWEN